ARLDRPHRPAPRCDPELLPVSRAAKPLSRSPCRTRRESPTTPQAASIQGFLGRFEPYGNRPAAKVCGNNSLAWRYESRFHRFRDRPFNGFIEDFRSILHYATIQL